MINLPQTAIADITLNMTGIISDLMPLILFLGGLISGVYIVYNFFNKDKKE